MGPGFDDGIGEGEGNGEGLGDTSGGSEGVTDVVAAGDVPGDCVPWAVAGFSLPHADRASAPSSAMANAARDAVLTFVQTACCSKELSSARAIRPALGGASRLRRLLFH